MTNRYEIVFKGVPIGRAYSTPDPNDPLRKNVSVMPLDRAGDFQAGTLEISVTELHTDSFPASTPDADAINAVLGLAAIEPWKVSVVPIA